MGLIQGGKIRENKEFGKIVGVFEADVLSINPTKEDLELIYGPQEKEPEYTKEKEVKLNEEGDTAIVASARMDVYLKDKKTKQLVKAVFYLEDRDKTNKDGTKTQYINSAGITSWVEDESELKEWFIARDYRKAKVGEDEIYGFAKAWLKYDFKDLGTAFNLADFGKMIQGDFSGFSSEINGDAAQTVLGLATIRTVEKDGVMNEYQGIYNRKFLPGYNMKFFRTKKFSPEIIEEIRQQDKPKPYERFIMDITDEEYGVKDYFVLEEARPYVEGENTILSTDSPLVEDDDSNY